MDALVAGGHPDAAQLDHLAISSLENREPMAGGGEGLQDLRLIEAIYRSAKEGRTVTL